MTDLLRSTEPVHSAARLIENLNNYQPDWSRNTMNYVNELQNQFYGWSTPSLSTSQGDTVTWVLLGFIALVLLFKK